jgi:hypothetical protein
VAVIPANPRESGTRAGIQYSPLVEFGATFRPPPWQLSNLTAMKNRQRSVYWIPALAPQEALRPE